MKKQYTLKVKNWYSDYLLIYENGKLVETIIVDKTNYDEEREKLEKNGYEYGYSKEKVALAKQSYEYKLKRIIEEEED